MSGVIPPHCHMPSRLSQGLECYTFTRWRWAVSFTPRYLLDRTLGRSLVPGPARMLWRRKTTDTHLFPKASLQWGHSELNEPIHSRKSEAEVCVYLMTLSAIHAVQLHTIALVHGEMWKTRDRTLHSRTKVLSMYKTRCSNSSYWTYESHSKCHCDLTQVLYMLLTQCLNLRGKVVKEVWLFLVLLDSEDKTFLYNISSHSTNSTMPQPPWFNRRHGAAWGKFSTNATAISQTIIQPMA